MARPKNPFRSPSVPLRIAEPLREKIREAAAELGLSEQDVMRLAMEIGLESLRRVNWNLAALVCDATQPGGKEALAFPVAVQRTAEAPPGSGYSPRPAPRPKRQA